MHPDRYFLDRDDDGHWYVIPVHHMDDWNAWRNLGSDDKRSWDVPSYAREVGGSHTLVSFSRPEIA